ncbi:signal transducer, putative [Talaromyces stipitatus ATCC 10500]|uniref:Signal transducer, putative n=1 Tax=Talaromyces stipitatus (strain ATCC 10500 / CBS 375.48 / QM 6759 / NRRL 1006) TaxID=441959 RepID=B8M2P4_TALSN|nr:signal transducer, putative [Talaromyces stipitatus ATCC 10500]EED21955.1 signal transducer, putative [Talaromyces stipitatus ATCC 10500]
MATPDETSSLTGADTGADTSDDEVVESLVAGRQKRSTAGRNMSSLLDAAADDDLTLLFAEDENDDEFDEEEGADGEFDDMRLDSSSEDEDDQGPNAADDDLEGEKELEKQARVERKKRKAQESLRLTALRKKVKIDSPSLSSTSATTPRPKKKSERVSWLPTPEEGPVRSSSRRQTMQNKELTHARLKDSEQRRIKLIANMEEAAKRKQRLKPKVMTQEERLAEAAKIERLNSKSLNRWEEMEKRKAEERKAKLEALQNRRLEGPVMSWWSGIAKWVNGKLVRVGNVEVQPKSEEKEPERKKKAKDTSQEAVKAESLHPTSLIQENTATVVNGETASALPNKISTQAQQNVTVTSPQGFLDGTHQHASVPTTPAPEKSEPEVEALPESARVEGTTSGKTAEGSKLENKPETKDKEKSVADEPAVDGKEQDTGDTLSKTAPEGSSTIADEAPKSETKSIPNASEAADSTAAETDKPVETKTTTEPAEQDTSTIAQTDSVDNPDIEPATIPATPLQENTEQADVSMQDVPGPTEAHQPTAVAEPTISEIEAAMRPEQVEQTGRNLLVLENFDNATIQSREYSIYFNAKKPPRLAKISQHLCPITSQLSRYRDPDTGLPFANVVGYREIRNLTEQKYAWSGMLGCYVGSATVAANGVPEQFITGVKPDRKAESTIDVDKCRSNGEAMEVDGS